MRPASLFQGFSGKLGVLLGDFRNWKGVIAKTNRERFETTFFLKQTCSSGGLVDEVLWTSPILSTFHPVPIF